MNFSTLLAYGLQLRDERSGAIVDSDAVYGNQGTAAGFVLPTLTDGKLYEFRVFASDGLANSDWSPWIPLGVDVAIPPDVPASLSLSPCAGACNSLTSTSVSPILTAAVGDSDSAALIAKFEVRRQGGSAILAAGYSDQVLPGTPVTFKVTPGVLANGANYEFRVTASDESSTTVSSWTPFSVAVPPGVGEASSPSVSPCVGSCTDLVSYSMSPTVTSAASSTNTSPVDLIFEVAGSGFTDSHTVSNVSPSAAASWSLPPTELSIGTYSIRVGSRGADGATIWTATTMFSLAPPDVTASSSFPEANVGQAASDPDPEATGRPIPDSSQDLEDTTVAPPMTEDQVYAGEVQQVNARGGVPYPPADLVPRIWLAPGEDQGPLSATTFINHSRLMWAHASCTAPNHTLDGHDVNAFKLGSGGYEHQTLGVLSVCSHHGDWHQSDEKDLNPFNGGGVGADVPVIHSREGMYMDLDDNYRHGADAATNGLNGNEPVYYKYVPYKYVVFWFHYGNSQIDDIPYFSTHEGDWEHVAVKLGSDDNKAEAVQYFQHKTSCTLGIDYVPTIHGHLKVWIGKHSHATYPESAVTPTLDFAGIPADIGVHEYKDHVGVGAKWYGGQNLKNLDDQLWYGYTGGWGQVGETGLTTGPSAPNLFSPEPPNFATRPCALP